MKGVLMLPEMKILEDSQKNLAWINIQQEKGFSTNKRKLKFWMIENSKWLMPISWEIQDCLNKLWTKQATCDFFELAEIQLIAVPGSMIILCRE